MTGNLCRCSNYNHYVKAVLAAAPKKSDPISKWVVALAERRGYWKAVVAMAAKNARMAWAVLRKGEAFALPA